MEYIKKNIMLLMVFFSLFNMLNDSWINMLAIDERCEHWIVTVSLLFAWTKNIKLLFSSPVVPYEGGGPCGEGK